MKSPFKNNPLHGVAIAAMLSVCAFATAAAQTSPNVRVIPFSSDAETEISTAKTYTHLLDFATASNQSLQQNTAVNGVAFLSTTGTSGSMMLGGNEYGWSGLPGSYTTVGNQGNIATPNTEAVYNILVMMNHNTPSGTMTFTGLTPGACYEARIYSRSWVMNADRIVNFVFRPNGNDASVYERFSVNLDSNAQDLMICFRYIAGENGELAIDHSAANNSNPLHLYAFSNEEVSEAALLMHGASDITSESATINADLFNPDGAQGTVTVYWGSKDGGENAGKWEDSETIGTFSTSQRITHGLSGLQPGATVFARLCFEAEGMMAWSSTVSFTMLDGWLQTGAGPYNFVDAANWASGNINGLWCPGLTLTTHQQLVLLEDFALPGGLELFYAGSFSTRLRGNTGRRTLYLNGDIRHETLNGIMMNFGQARTEQQSLDVDLGGVPRTFSVLPNRSIVFDNRVLNMDSVLLTGGGIVSFRGDEFSQPDADIIVEDRTTLTFNTDGGNGNLRADGVHLKTAILSINGNTSSDVTNAFNRLVIGADDKGGGNNRIALASNGNREMVVALGSLERDEYAIAQIHGNNLGQVPGSNVATVLIDSPPELAGSEEGMHETPSAKIIPWLYYGGASDGAYHATDNSLIMTYDANGLRPLDMATEYRTYANGYEGGALGDCENIFLPRGASITFTEDVVVNSISGGYGQYSINGTNKVHVASGLVMLRCNDKGIINAPLDFTGAQAIFASTAGKTSFVNTGISGDQGAVFYSFISARPNSTVTDFSGNNHTITGDFYVHCRLHVNSGCNVLPYDTREGDVRVYGQLVFWNGGTFNVNGLKGNGTVILDKAATLHAGHRNADSVFGGQITSNGSLRKVGEGTLSLIGDNSTYQGVTAIQNGVLEAMSINRIADPLAGSSLGHPTTVANGTIAIGNGSTNATLRYVGPGESTDRVINLAGSTGGATLDASGSGAVVFESDLTATVNGEKTLTLAGTNTMDNAILGAIPNRSAAYPTSLLKTGNGTWVLGGANTYTGDTIVEDGTLRLAGGSLQSTVTVAAGATFGGCGVVENDVEFLDGAQFIGSTNGALVVSGELANNSAVTTVTLAEMPERGNVYELLRASNIDGSFVLAPMPGLSSRWTVFKSRDNTKLWLSDNPGVVIIVR